MKLLRFDLTAFGPFTGRVLDLGAGREGLHVLFGRNEAGKSSALRALHAVLYGIPGQTSDGFIHSYADLRLGAHLRAASGKEIEFTRRKGNKGTLLRSKSGRAFFYRPRLSHQDLLSELAGSTFATLLPEDASSVRPILSMFVDTVGKHDHALLDELEKLVRARRDELKRKEPK